MPDRRVRAVGVPMLVGGLVLAVLAVGVGAGAPDQRGPAVTAATGRPAVLLDHGHDAERGDAVHTLSGTLYYVDSPGCFVLADPGNPPPDALAYPRRPVVWPGGTRGVRDGARVGVRLPTGEQIWSGQTIDVAGTPVADNGTARLPPSVATTCRSAEYVVLERLQGAMRATPTSALDPRQPWTDAGGNPLPRDRIFAEPGDGWCNWEAMTLLVVTSGQGEDTVEGGYVRDPFGMLADREQVSFDAHARLPAAARPTGWKQRDIALWLTDDAAYLVSDDRTERWSRLTRPMGCA